MARADELDRLAAQMAHGTSSVRMKTLHQLGEMWGAETGTEPVLRALIACLQDHSKQVRLAALEEMAAHADVSVRLSLPALQRFLLPGQPVDEAIEALIAISTLGPQAAPSLDALGKCLGFDDPRGAQATWAIGRIGTSARAMTPSIAARLARIDISESLLLRTTLSALRSLADVRALPILRKLARGKDLPDLQASVALCKTIEALGDLTLAEELGIRCLRTYQDEDPGHQLFELMRTPSSARTRIARRLLGRALTGDSKTRLSSAIKAVARLGLDEWSKQLGRVISSEPRRSLATDALHAVAALDRVAPECVDSARRALADPQPDVRVYAAITLMGHDTERAVAYLEGTLRTDSGDVESQDARNLAARALLRMRRSPHPEALAFFGRALQGPDSRECYWALVSLSGLPNSALSRLTAKIVPALRRPSGGVRQVARRILNRLLTADEDVLSDRERELLQAALEY